MNTPITVLLISAFCSFSACNFSFNIKDESCGYFDSSSLQLADDANLIINDKTYGMSEYFYNLRNNLPNNQQGSCGYVALSMLFSLYDSFVSDNFLPEQYDVPGDLINSTSPGCLYDTVTGYNSVQEYYLDKSTQSAYSIHSLLITIGYQLGYLNLTNVLNNGSLAINSSNMQNLGNNYLHNVLNYSQSEASIVKLNDSSKDLSQQIREKIFDGNPVIIDLTTHNMKHFAIAYAVDDSSRDAIYLHMGYSDSFFISIEDGIGSKPEVNYYSNAYYLDYNIRHFHSNNYYNSQTNTNSCSCTNFQHDHDYSYDYSHFLQNNYHSAYCYCESSIHKNHVFRYDNHYLICDLCGYSKYTPYEFGG